MTALCLCGAAADPAIACDCGATFCGANHRGEHRQGGCPTTQPVEHRAEIDFLTGTPHAQCSCGWKGEPEPTTKLALADWGAHVADGLATESVGSITWTE